MPINGIRGPGGMEIPGQPVVRPMFRALGIAASGLSAQRQRMETIAQNIANADTTRGPDGAPYRRRAAVLEAATVDTAQYPPIPNLPGAPGAAAVSGRGSNRFGSLMDGPRTIEVPVLLVGGTPFASPNGDGQFGVTVAGVAEDVSDGRLVYEPGHPDADKDGFVRYPNVDTTQELVNIMDAKRMYEANASVFQTAKAMLRAALDI